MSKEKFDFEKKLIESQNNLKNAQRIAKLGHYTYNFISKNHFWSDQFYRVLNLKPNEVKASSEEYYKRVHPEDKNWVKEESNIAKENKELLNINYRLLLNNSEVKYVNEIAEFILDNESNIISTLGIIQDVTEKTLTEFKLQESEERFRLAMKGTNDGLWEYDAVNETLFFTPRYKEKLGYQDHELDNNVETWYNLLHPDDKEKAIQKDEDFKKSPPSQLSYESEFRLQHKEGHYLNILSKAFAERFPDGKLKRIVGTHADITQRKKIEAKISQLNKELEDKVKQRTLELTLEKNFSENIINSLPGIFSLIALDGTHLKWNRNHQKVTGYSDEEYKKMKAFDFFSEKTVEGMQEDLEQLYEKGFINVEALILTKSGSEIPHFLSGSIVTINNEQYVAGMGIDISAQKQVENQLREKTAELETFNKTMINRELRIIEMKEKVNELSKKLGEKPPYNEIWNKNARL